MEGPVVDWDLEKVIEEYNTGEKLTPEEEIKLEEQLNKYMHEYAMNEIKVENENLRVKVEEMTKRAEEETIKREKAEEEIKQGQELIRSLRRSLASRGMKGEVRREEAPYISRRRSRVRCWDLTRPGGCRYGARCRYLHPGVEVVRAEESQQDFPVAPAMAGGQVYGQQQPRWWIDQQMNQQMNTPMIQQMNKQTVVGQVPMMMQGPLRWPAHLL